MSDSRITLASWCVMWCLGCADLPPSAAASASSALDAGAAAVGADLTALRATGVAKYLGAARPVSSELGRGGEMIHRFDVADGPMCLRGAPYAMSTRSSRDQHASDLLIYLQGGGSCSSAICSATETADPTFPTYGLLNPNDPDNPFASWNMVDVPYCDGSLHYGDADHADESPPRFHHGLRNLSAALDVTLKTFPDPKRILLAGSSAGGLGTIYASMLVRLLYPNAQLFTFNDSGTGLSVPDGSRAKLTRPEWGIEQLIPASCSECLASPHSTPVIAWDMQHDPELRVAFFSAYEDSVIADAFLMIGGPAFKATLLDETGKIMTAHGDRARRFFIEGQQHTTAADIHTTIVNGVSIGQWLGFMLRGDARWADTLQ